MPTKPVELTVRLDAGCDFADLFEVKDALEKKGTYSTRVEGGKLVLALRARDLRPRDRDLGVGAGAGRRGRAHLQDPHRAARRVERRELDVVTVRGSVPDWHARRLEDPKRRTACACERNLERWIDEAPRLECDWEPLKATYRRSLVDLAALRFSPLDRRRAQPSGGGPARGS